MEQHGGATRLREVLKRALLVIWALAMLLMGTALMAAHWVPLPVPTRPELGRELLSLEGSLPGRWQLVHVLFNECRCSQRLLDHLFARATPEGAQERIILVGQDERRASQARDHAFAMSVVTPEELSRRFGIETVPLLVVVDPEGVVRYVGGYTTHPQGLDYQEIEILSRARQQQAMSALPAFGCAVSERLRAYLDPLGLKYSP